MSITELIMLGGLTVLSIFDLWTRKVPVCFVILLGIVALICGLADGAAPLMLAAGIIPGVLVILLAFCSRESIGIGDGLVLCVLGLFCGARQVIAVFAMALLFSALLAMVLLVLRRAGRKTELPFLPCLWAGYLLCLVW